MLVLLLVWSCGENIYFWVTCFPSFKNILPWVVRSLYSEFLAEALVVNFVYGKEQRASIEVSDEHNPPVLHNALVIYCRTAHAA